MWLDIPKRDNMKKKLIKILLIEDDIGEADLIQEMLFETNNVSFKLTYLDRLKLAMNKLDNNTFDLILLDLNLPDSYGLETLIKLNKKVPELPIIVFTGLEDEEMGIKAVKEGAQDYLVKGKVDVNILIRSIHYAVERKKVEEERERLSIQLKEKNKELEQIVYITSHDLRSPLVNIQGFAKELENSINEISSIIENEEIPSTMREKLKPIIEEDFPEAMIFIKAGINKIDNLLLSLLRLSRLGRAALTIEHLDMNKLMVDVAKAFEFQVKEANVTLEISKLPSSMGDKIQINQLFSNLIDNALKYLDTERPGIIKISGYKEEQFVVYCVEDNGIGIPIEHQKKIFEIFHRINPSSGTGEGLGLTIVSKILSRHGGNIWLESEFCKGSKFFLSLPNSKDFINEV